VTKPRSGGGGDFISEIKLIGKSDSTSNVGEGGLRPERTNTNHNCPKGTRHKFKIIAVDHSAPRNVAGKKTEN